MVRAKGRSFAVISRLLFTCLLEIHFLPTNKFLKLQFKETNEVVANNIIRWSLRWRVTLKLNIPIHISCPL